MAVSKRTRFEILRRDNHTCQYCGQKAPDVELHVDHIIPVTLGGDDKPSNLLAACVDCNRGKTSISPDSPIVEAIGIRSAEYAIANLNRAARIDGDLTEMDEYEEAFLEKWDAWKSNKTGSKVPLPAGWRNSLKAWWKISVPSSLIESAVDIAMNAPGITSDETFRYFAGVVWRTLDEYDARYPHQTNAARVYTQYEYDDAVTEARIEGYTHGQR